MKDKKIDPLDECWSAYLDVAVVAAKAVAAPLRKFVEGVAFDGRPRFANSFAIESANTKSHRGPRRRLVSQGRPAVANPDGVGTVDLRGYMWTSLVYKEENGSLTPIADVMFCQPHIDNASRNKHVAANRICLVPAGCDGLDDPAQLVLPIGELRSNVEAGTLKKLEDAIEASILEFSADRGIDPRSGKEVA